MFITSSTIAALAMLALKNLGFFDNKDNNKK